jgi:hypothetical protein
VLDRAPLVADVDRGSGARVTDKRAYFKMDVGYLTNPKVTALVEEHPRAVLLHLQCIAYATQHFTNGIVPVRLAMRLACSEQCDLDLLVQCGLLIDHGNGNAEVHDYLEHQRSAEEVKAASDKGRRAAEARWSDASGNAPSMPDALPNPMPRKREREKEQEGRFDEFWDLYPKKESKQAALRKWNTTVKAVSARDILDGLQRSVDYWQSKGTERQFIPAPDVWLNKGRWADELDTAPEGSSWGLAE